jgi:hypothetical protein
VDADDVGGSLRSGNMLVLINEVMERWAWMEREFCLSFVSFFGSGFVAGPAFAGLVVGHGWTVHRATLAWENCNKKDVGNRDFGLNEPTT